MSRLLAHGTKLKMGDGATSETFATVAQLTRIGLPQTTRASVDTSDHDTTGAMTFEPSSLYDGGTVAIEGHIDPTVATHGYTAGTGFVAAAQAGTKKNWQIESPDGTWHVTFTGFFSSFGGDAPSESGAGKITFTGELKLTGAPTWAAI